MLTRELLIIVHLLHILHTIIRFMFFPLPAHIDISLTTASAQKYSMNIERNREEKACTYILREKERKIISHNIHTSTCASLIFHMIFFSFFFRIKVVFIVENYLVYSWATPEHEQRSSTRAIRDFCGK
jgi:hypothetical protein